MRGVLIRETNIYISPDSNSAKLVTAERGRDLAVLDKTTGWLHVIVEITQPMQESRAITGWIVDKGVDHEEHSEWRPDHFRRSRG